jgi:hypothetical protein
MWTGFLFQEGDVLIKQSHNYYAWYFACAPILARIVDIPEVRVYHRVKYRPSTALALRSFLYTKL